ncbi:hypothetical protein Hanom_Chr04g00352331 [Helianthus anomalus]
MAQLHVHYLSVPQFMKPLLSTSEGKNHLCWFVKRKLKRPTSMVKHGDINKKKTQSGKG